MKTTYQIVAPRYSHDCDCCRFVGFDGDADVYMHGETVIRRFSSDGPDYASFPMGIAKQVPAYANAVALCVAYQPLEG